MAASHHEAAAEDMKKLRESYTNLATNHQHLKKDHQKLIGELKQPILSVTYLINVLQPLASNRKGLKAWI